MNIPQNQFEQTFSSNTQTQSLAKTFMTNVFSWMFIALGITALTAYLFASSESLLSLMYSETGLSILGWAVMIALLDW